MDIKVKVCKIILLDTAALTSVSVMFLDHRNATTGGSGNNWPAFHFFQFLSNDDGRCLKFSLNRNGKLEQGLLIFFSLYSSVDLHRRSPSINHVVTSVASDVFNCNTHKRSIVRRQERSITYFAMSIAKHLMWFTCLTVTSVGRNT